MARRKKVPKLVTVPEYVVKEHQKVIWVDAPVESAPERDTGGGGLGIALLLIAIVAGFFLISSGKSSEANTRTAIPASSSR
jgi:hypothetical protein